MKNTTGFYPRLRVDTAATPAVGQAGGVLLTQTVAASGMGRELSAALAPWRRPFAVHDPAKVLLDLAIAAAIGGTHLDDAALLRAEPEVYGRVASDPTITRTIAALARDAAKALAAIDTARAAARANAWAAAGVHAPDHGCSARDPLIVDLDATLITAHSEKENARATFKRGFGFHPLCAFVDHGADGTGEPLAILLRPGNAGSNTAADHITVIRNALAQLPGHTRGTRPGRKVLIRTDAAGCTHAVLRWMHARRLSYSVGFTLPEDTPELLAKIPEHVWAPAIDADGDIREGAWVAELSGLLDLSGWPPGMRVIARKENPTPAHSCASTTSTANGSPRSRPTPRPAARAPSCPPWSYATGAGPAAMPRRRPRRRPARLDADARPALPPRPPLGTQDPARARLLHPRHARPPRPTRPAPPVKPRPPPGAADRRNLEASDTTCHHPNTRPRRSSPGNAPLAVRPAAEPE